MDEAKIDKSIRLELRMQHGGKKRHVAIGLYLKICSEVRLIRGCIFLKRENSSTDFRDQQSIRAGDLLKTRGMIEFQLRKCGNNPERFRRCRRTLQM